LPEPVVLQDSPGFLAAPMAERALASAISLLLVSEPVAAGYRADLVEAFAADLPAAWSVAVLDTGVDSATGARVRACRDHVGERFFVTYGDGVGDVDLGALQRFHDGHDGVVTVTTVALPSPYGTLELDGDGRVARFEEKPSLPEHRINAGFMVVDQAAFDHWDGDDLEREVLPALAARGSLFAYDHHGFWRSMDTYKDALELSELCRDGAPPWLAGGAGCGSLG
jgi:glucose-1-phosphate cytidylyltransferase